MNNKLKIWNEFSQEYGVLEQGVPLFQTTANFVDTFSFGMNQRKLLQRSPQMESLVIEEVQKVIEDYEDDTKNFDGLIYMMYWKDGEQVIPLYIGKSEKYGKNNGNLSINIKNIEKNSRNFCRWGYNYAYHIGDLSAVACPNHPIEKQTFKYKRWAERLFESIPTENPKLKQETFFWMMAWSKQNAGVWKEFGETSLTFLEYLLIGLASEVFPEYLLNSEGVNRK